MKNLAKFLIDEKMSSRIVQIIFEMFEQRGYTDIETNAEGQIFATKPNSRLVLAFPSPIENPNVEAMQNVKALMEKNEVSHSLIVCSANPTPAFKTALSKILELDFIVEVFQEEDLQYNITKHSLVPAHIKMSKEDQKKFRELYGVNIPVLLRTDAVAKFYNFKKGEIVKIIRRNGYVSYRIVR